jgi:hypothetical protein
VRKDQLTTCVDVLVTIQRFEIFSCNYDFPSPWHVYIFECPHINMLVVPVFGRKSIWAALNTLDTRNFVKAFLSKQNVLNKQRFIFCCPSGNSNI